MLWKFKLLLENLWNWGTEINQTGLVMEYGEARSWHAKALHFKHDIRHWEICQPVCKRLVGTSIGWPRVLKDVAAAGIPRTICSILEKHFFFFFFTLLWVLFNILEQRFNAFALPTCATSVLYLCISAYGETEYVVSEQWYLCQYSIYIFFRSVWVKFKPGIIFLRNTELKRHHEDCITRRRLNWDLKKHV